jgi:hypothetical protein
MLSHVELRHVIETAFLPSKCHCEIAPDGIMSIELTHPDSGEVELSVTGISVYSLATSRALAALVGELKEEARLTQLLKGRRSSKAG